MIQYVLPLVKYFLSDVPGYYFLVYYYEILDCGEVSCLEERGFIEENGGGKMFQYRPKAS